MEIEEHEFYIMKKSDIQNIVCNDIEIREVNSLVDLHIYVKLFLKNFEISKRKYIFYFVNSLFREQYYNYIVYDKKKPIGTFTVIIEDDMPYIYDFSLLKEFRGKGYGSKMIDWICEEFEDWGALMLTVCPTNLSAINLYELKGFEIVGFKAD